MMIKWFRTINDNKFEPNKSVFVCISVVMALICVVVHTPNDPRRSLNFQRTTKMLFSLFSLRVLSAFPCYEFLRSENDPNEFMVEN